MSLRVPLSQYFPPGLPFGVGLGVISILFFSLAWQKISLAFSLARSDFCATGNRQKLC